MLSLIVVALFLIAIEIVAVILLRQDDGRQNHKKLVYRCIWGAIIGIAVGLLGGAFSLGNFTLLLFMAMGVLASSSIELFCNVTKKIWKKKETVTYYDDGTPRKFYVTGDKHRDFSSVKRFCRDMKTRRKDVLIILGDSGFNYYEDQRDDELKKDISSLNITLFCLHGNKENRPQNIVTYGIRSFCGGKVYYEPRYPNIFFAIDGEIYVFEGKRYMAVGGAHSVDKLRCLENGLPFFKDEMPDGKTKALVEANLKKMDNKIYGIMTHTCPLKYLPNEMLMSTQQSADIKRKPQKSSSKKIFKPHIDRSTEEWLDKLENRLDYKVWLCGHYHVDKQIDKLNMMYREIRPLHQYSSEV